MVRSCGKKKLKQIGMISFPKFSFLKQKDASNGFPAAIFMTQNDVMIIFVKYKICKRYALDIERP